MATMQIRNVPDYVHDAYRRRAAAAGMSLQEYLLAELVEGARTRTPAEIADEVSRARDERGGEGYADVSAASYVRAERESR